MIRSDFAPARLMSLLLRRENATLSSGGDVADKPSALRTQPHLHTQPHPQSHLASLGRCALRLKGPSKDTQRNTKKKRGQSDHAFF